MDRIISRFVQILCNLVNQRQKNLLAKGYRGFALRPSAISAVYSDLKPIH
jgi:hypothetical protein